MDSTKDPILEFLPGTIQAIRKMYDLDSPARLEEAIQLFQDWIKKQSHFTKTEFDRDYLERLIIVNKGLLERAKSRLEKTCTLRTILPEFFGNYNIRDDAIFKGLEHMRVAVLPKPTPEYSRVYLIKQIGKDWSNELFMKVYKRAVVCWEYLLKYDYSTGFYIILDYNENDIVEHIAKMGWTEFRQIMNLFMEGYGMRVKGIHIVTKSKVVDALVGIFRQIFPAKIAARIKAHSSMDALYDIIPKDIMPVEYGGKELPLAELEAKWLDVLSTKEHMEYVKEMNEARTDESKRSVDNFNEKYLGIPGSFRSLVVD